MSDARSTSARLELQLADLKRQEMRQFLLALPHEPAGALHDGPPVGRRPGKPVRKATVGRVDRAPHLLRAQRREPTNPFTGVRIDRGDGASLGSDVGVHDASLESGHLGFPRRDPLTPADSSPAAELMTSPRRQPSSGPSPPSFRPLTAIMGGAVNECNTTAFRLTRPCTPRCTEAEGRLTAGRGMPTHFMLPCQGRRGCSFSAWGAEALSGRSLRISTGDSRWATPAGA